jgi:hypothetical protein
MATTARAILAAGLVRLAAWNTVAQAFDGFGESLDADKFEIKPDSEKKTSTSKSHLDWGQARASIVVPKPTQINVELSASSVKALAMQFQGQVEALSQGAGNLTNQDVVIPTIGEWVSLGKRNFAEAGFSIVPNGGGTAYVRGVNYEVNWSRGEIRFIPGAAGNPAAAATVDVTGAYAAVDGKKIIGGKVTQVRAKLRFDGQNMVNGEVVEADVFDCTLGTSDGFDFLGSDFSAIKLSGEITNGYEVVFPQRSGD